MNLSVSAYAGQIVSSYLHVDDKQEKCESVRVALTPEALNEKLMEALKNKAIGDSQKDTILLKFNPSCKIHIDNHPREGLCLESRAEVCQSAHIWLRGIRRAYIR